MPIDTIPSKEIRVNVNWEETNMSETKKPDIVKASMEHKGMRVVLSRNTGTGYSDAVLEIETPEGDSIQITGMAVAFLRYNLHDLGKATGM